MTYLRLFCSLVLEALHSRTDLLLEILALRQQVVVLSRRSPRPRLTATDRIFWSALSRLWSGWRSAVLFVQPETVIRWQRTAWRCYWTWRSRRGRVAGRSRLPIEVRELIMRMARENPLWGSVRIPFQIRMGFCPPTSPLLLEMLRHVRRQLVRHCSVSSLKGACESRWPTLRT